ncbi:DUF3999 family protein [Lacihabitans sp. LS3-19]|uniref:DUF3999 family protein n=1 Tax=Lacihabitans sp. LS3-19 TaxID=2487335 RepID=UPI0020CB8DEA|nr:DUF3999 family protein [Lacihabitans sp. LS3-19]MCP9767612.1 DUF3999 family protein [Lacihabitans sp. LS3-19]
MKINYSFGIFLAVYLASFQIFSQFQYKRKILGIENEWQKIDLPVDIHEKTVGNFNDIRIIGIKNIKDTIEMPFLFSNKIPPNESVNFNIINTSKSGGEYFFTLESKKPKEINQINLKFGNANFEWNADFQGSDDLINWFEILEEIRLVGLKNEEANFQFSKLKFAKSKFRYYRTKIKTNVQPNLISATYDEFSQKFDETQKTNVINLKTQQNSLKKQTIIEAELDFKSPINSLKIELDKPVDYLRNITIEYEEIHYDKKQNPSKIFQTAYNGSISSLKKNVVSFETLISKKIRLTIYNTDNQALNIKNIELFGPKNIIIARFQDPTLEYYLVYGNSKISKPNYDLINFSDKIPIEISNSELGKEEINLQLLESNKTAFNFSKYLIWCILFIILLVVAWFSIQMLKEKQQKGI